MKTAPGKTIVGFVGLGVMGQSMAGHILNAGYELHVYNRTRIISSQKGPYGKIRWGH